MLQRALPTDSIFHDWLEARSIIETPISYDLFCAMSVLGALLRRSLWVDQLQWKVYPSLSVLLVGHSGVGKNTAMSGSERIINALSDSGLAVPPVIGGATIETIKYLLGKLGRPAAAILFAEELSALIGKKDYQGGIIQGLTDLLDCKDRVNITLKSENGGREQWIYEPTLTIQAGTTPEWLHTAMPVEIMGGGFLPRFVILCEERVKRQVALVKALPEGERRAAAAAQERFLERLRLTEQTYRDFGEMRFEKQAAEPLYQEWYAKREEYFSKLARPYAHRARDHALRMAMICAISRSAREISEADVHFAIAAVDYIAQRVDVAIASPTLEGKCCRELLRILPSQHHKLVRELAKSFSPRCIRDSLQVLVESRQIRVDERTGMVEKEQIS